ncbi:MAG: ribokinase [Chloroflexi bacterium]|nr:ribokinase [Chloroflexota bacterium]
MIIVEVGSLNMDLVVRIPKIPRPGETLLGGVFKTIPGGKGANQAVAAARLGAHVQMIGCVGNDSFGQEMQATLSNEGIDTTHILVHPKQSTGVALIQVDSQGQNSIAVASGANLCLTSEAVKKALQSIGNFDALVMPLETPLETIYTAAQIASHKGAIVLLNPAPAQVLEKNLLKMIDILIPNEFEIAFMTDLTIQSDANLNQSADKLLSQGVKHLIITLGSRGAIYFNGSTKEYLSIPAFQMETVDTTAAGDCFVGALAVGLCEGKSIEAAAEFASAAAAISVTRFGAQPSLPRRREVAEFMQERNKTI